MRSEYLKHKKVLGIEDGFTYIQLTKRFTELKKNANDEQLEEIADAYDFMRRNYKKLKDLKVEDSSEIENSIFPVIKQEVIERPRMAVEYPVFRKEDGSILDIIMVPDTKHGALPTIPKGDFKAGQKITFFHNNKLFMANTNTSYKPVGNEA